MWHNGKLRTNFGMAFRVWVILFAAFVFVSLVVYIYCDNNNTEGMPSAQVTAGWQAWQENNCQSCHQLYGLGGYMGPDLTNTYSEKGKGLLYMQSIIKHGTGRMPDFNLSDTDANNLVQFLEWVDRSGMSKVKAGDVHWSGTYSLEKK
jgi:nitric oxide reductase subunit C